MCVRYKLAKSLKTLQTAFPQLELPLDIPPRYNIAPSQPVAVVPNDGQNKVDFFVWGLIPSWAKDPKIGNRLLNARGETLGEKPSFRSAYKRRRCLLLADGFYEWVGPKGTKNRVPHYIYLRTEEPFAFAGLWESWQSPDGSLIKTCTMVTTEPNEMIAKLHNRMPVILPPMSYEVWLDPGEKTPEELNHLLKPYPAEEMAYYAISTLVNKPANDNPEVINPLEDLPPDSQMNLF